jgi:riboflavin kinase/FMN adenylyltransferase
LKIYNSVNSYKNDKKAIVTIGIFDGVHLGHSKILNRITQSALDFNCDSIVLTFFPHPRMILDDKSEIKLLNTINEKVFLIEKTGLSNLIIHPFNKAFSELSAEEFVEKILVEKLNIQKIIIGHDHRFGKNRNANIDDLIHFGKKYNFEVEQISAEEINEVSISSTKIRNALSEGNIDLATEYLGYNYLLTGIVSKGKQLGRTIGYPTANIQIKEDYKLLPKNGVYIVKSTIKNKTVFGMMNIGVRPTVNGVTQTIEIHFFNYNDDLYEQEIVVSILKRIRNEQKFESLDALKDQLALDKATSLAYLTKF